MYFLDLIGGTVPAVLRVVMEQNILLTLFLQMLLVPKALALDKIIAVVNPFSTMLYPGGGGAQNGPSP